MKYFVTGATGFIGEHLARQLASAGHDVIILARTPAKASALADLGITVCQGDITDKESMRAPMTGVDGIFHVAAWYKIGARDHRLAEHINVDGTRNVLELMKELNIPRGVYTSTLAVNSDTHGRVVDETYRFEGQHISEYDRTKWRAHYEVAEPMIRQGLPLVIVQPGLVYGPGDTSVVRQTLIQYLRRRLPMMPQKTAYCWAHVDDIARGHAQAMEKGRLGESYLLAGPVHTFIEAMELAERVTGIPAPRIRPTPEMVNAMSVLMGIVGAVFPLPETYSAEALRTFAGATYLGSNEKARRELGFTVRPLEEGWPATILLEMKQLGLKPKAESVISKTGL